MKNYLVEGSSIYSSDLSKGIRKLYIGEQHISKNGSEYTFDLNRGEYVDSQGNALQLGDIHQEETPLQRLEEKVDFLLQKQVQRDLEDALQQLEVTPNV